MELMNHLIGLKSGTLEEGQVPVETAMILDRVIANDGKLLDSVGVVTIASLCQAMKDGDLSQLTAATSAELVQHIRGLGNEKLVKLAKALKKELEKAADDKEAEMFDKSKSVTDWVRFVLAKQD